MPRLDVLLAERGLAESRSRAQALILAGRVTVDGAPAGKAGVSVRDDAEVAVSSPPRFVSRGGEKLAVALDELQVPVEGRLALDVGASTGGFTDCLLQAGAARVVALDVGRGQLHERVRRDPRVHVMERVNVRELQPSDLPFVPDLATIDVSFISLSLVLGPVAAALARPFDIVALVKPQFEAGRREARGGVVRDPELHRDVLRRVAAHAVELGTVVLGACDSRHPGPAGNREFFLRLTSPDHPAAAGGLPDLDALVTSAVA